MMNALAELLPQEEAHEQSRENFEGIIRYLDSGEVSSMSHSELERELEKRGRELMRLLMQEHLDTRSPGESKGPVRDSDAVDRSRVRLQERKLETVFGTVSVERAGYGREGAKSLHPLDGELNLPAERYSLELRRRVAEEAAKGSFEQTLKSIEKTTGGHVPKRQIEEMASRAAQDFDAFYQTRQAGPVEETGPLLVLSVDGKGVVMRTEDLREKTRQAASERKHKMGARLSKGEKRNAKRMATVAAVYTIEPFVRTPEDLMGEEDSPRAGPSPPRPEQKRIWAKLEKRPEEVIEEAFEEALLRDSAQEKTWVALVDGAKSQIRTLGRLAKKKGVDLIIIVDIIHVSEYLWDAGRVFSPQSGPELEGWVKQRLLEILRGKAGYVAGGMRRSATLRGLSKKAREPVDRCARYLLNHTAYLHYERYLTQGLPIATGVIEGACRHLVKDRMEVSGARWSLRGAEAVLRLRALYASHDFEEYWSFHEAREYERNHQSLYEDGVVPPTVKPHATRKQRQLKIIK
jgi:hypothetical protein